MNALKKAKSTSKPLRKMKPFARWTVDGGLLLYQGWSVLLSFWEDANGHMRPDIVAKVLNKRRVTLKVRP